MSYIDEVIQKKILPNDYPEWIKELVLSNKYTGRMNDPTGAASVKGNCGDEIEVYLYIIDGFIKEAKIYTENSCSSTIFCGIIAAEYCREKTIMQALELSPSKILNRCNNSLNVEPHCAILVSLAFLKAMGDYFLKP